MLGMEAFSFQSFFSGFSWVNTSRSWILNFPKIFPDVVSHSLCLTSAFSYNRQYKSYFSKGHATPGAIFFSPICTGYHLRLLSIHPPTTHLSTFLELEPLLLFWTLRHFAATFSTSQLRMHRDTFWVLSENVYMPHLHVTTNLAEHRIWLKIIFLQNFKDFFVFYHPELPLWFSFFCTRHLFFSLEAPGVSLTPTFWTF